MICVDSHKSSRPKICAKRAQIRAKNRKKPKISKVYFCGMHFRDELLVVMNCLAKPDFWVQEMPKEVTSCLTLVKGCAMSCPTRDYSKEATLAKLEEPHLNAEYANIYGLNRS